MDFLDAGVHLLILDLFLPTKRDPEGIHAAIWSKLDKQPFHLPPGKPLTLVAYTGGRVKRAYSQPVAIGESVPEMPLFLDPEYLRSRPAGARLPGGVRGGARAVARPAGRIRLTPTPSAEFGATDAGLALP